MMISIVNREEDLCLGLGVVESVKGHGICKLVAETVYSQDEEE